MKELLSDLMDWAYSKGFKKRSHSVSDVLPSFELAKNFQTKLFAANVALSPFTGFWK